MDKLLRLKDPLIKKFYKEELKPLQTDNKYHSPEVSETDNEVPNKRKIAIRNLKWRSSTVSMLFIFLFNIFSNRYLLIY